jgi:hypothetical protein
MDPNITRFPLLDALLQRRSRRFAPGMELDGGPLAYKSSKPPLLRRQPSENLQG